MKNVQQKFWKADGWMNSRMDGWVGFGRDLEGSFEVWWHHYRAER